jgi:peptide/nickel transport system permease protein
MVSEGRTYILDQWWISTFPGLAIFVSVLAVNILGDLLRDMLDPRRR